jgi:hypothetical protein
MKYLITFLALVPFMYMGTVFLYGSGFVWFDETVVWLGNLFSFSIPAVKHKLYYLSKVAGLSALWILVLAFWVNPLHTYVRFDLREFKKLLGGFAVAYGVLHLVLFIAAHQFALGTIGKLFFTHLFLSVGLAALLIFSIAPNVKAWYKMLYIGIVLVIIHLLLGYRSLEIAHIAAISLLSLGLALRLIKR